MSGRPILLVGPQGSGKSHRARELLGNGYIHVGTGSVSLALRHAHGKQPPFSDHPRPVLVEAVEMVTREREVVDLLESGRLLGDRLVLTSQQGVTAIDRRIVEMCSVEALAGGAPRVSKEAEAIMREHGDSEDFDGGGY